MEHGPEQSNLPSCSGRWLWCGGCLWPVGILGRSVLSTATFPYLSKGPCHCHHPNNGENVLFYLIPPFSTDSEYPPGDGGAVCIPPRTASALVRS